MNDYICPNCGEAAHDCECAAQWGLLLPFDTDSEEFARGVEVGRLWEMFKRDEEPFSQTIHATNAEMVLRMGERLGRSIRTDELGSDWLELHVARAEVEEVEDDG
jgi:hypothetical protein